MLWASLIRCNHGLTPSSVGSLYGTLGQVGLSAVPIRCCWAILVLQDGHASIPRSLMLGEPEIAVELGYLSGSEKISYSSAAMLIGDYRPRLDTASPDANMLGGRSRPLTCFFHKICFANAPGAGLR